MADPVQTLARLWRWVRPGGRLLIMDYDCSVVRSLKRGDAFDRGIASAMQAFEAGGRTIDIGTRMPLLFLQACIGRADGTDVSGILQSGASGATMLRGLVRSWHPAILGSRQMDEAELQRIDVEMAAEADSPSVYSRLPDMVATWKRKPRAETVH